MPSIAKRVINNTRALLVLFTLNSFLPAYASAQNAAAEPPALASYDWSVSSLHNLASNPPQTDVVQAFVNAAFRTDFSKVCHFRFADLRGSGNLSLVVSIDAGRGCDSTSLFDKTASGFEYYGFNAIFLTDHGIQDINADGKFQLVLWAPLLPLEL